MKKSFIFMSILHLWSFYKELRAQCTPNPNQQYTYGWGVIPDAGSQIPSGTVGEPYSFTFLFRAPETVQDVVDAGFFPDCPFYACGLNVDEVQIMNISGMPSGLSRSCNPSSCTWQTQEDGCVVVSGTPTEASPGGVPQLVDILLEGRVTVGVWPATYTETREYHMLFYIQINAPPCFLQASTQRINESTPNAFDGQAIVTATGGTPPYSYQWSNNATNNQINGLTAGTYTVTVTDQANCTVIESVQIETTNTNPCQNFNVSLSSQNESFTNASDGQITANVSNGQAPYTYQWSNGNNTNPNPNLSTGPYTVTVTDNLGCVKVRTLILGVDSIVNDTTIINPCANFGIRLIDIQNESNPNAANGAATVTIDNGTPPYQITWSTGSTNTTINQLSSDYYWVYVSDANQCNTRDTVFISLNDSNAVCNLNINFIKTNETATNANNGILGVSATGGTGPYSYNWSNGSTNQNLSNLSPGIYYVTATDATGCNGEDSVKIFAYGDTTCALNIALNTIPESAPNLLDGVASALANGGTPPYLYDWSNGQNTPTISQLSTGNYIVTITDQNLCSVTRLISIAMGPISTTELPEQKNWVRLYPNPVQDHLTLEFLEPTIFNPIMVNIYNLAGVLVKSQAFNNASDSSIQHLNLNDLSQGIYHIHLQSTTNTFTQKIVLLK